jgi:hypothetical protein
MIKLRKVPSKCYNIWDDDLEPGMRVYKLFYDDVYLIYELKESTGRNKRDSGSLTPILIKKNGKPRLAKYLSGIGWVWIE